MKRLLYITDAEALGGAEGYLETLLTHADRSRYEVALALPPRSATQPLIERAHAMGVTVHALDVVHRDGVSVAGVVRSAALLRRLQPEIVHFVLNGPRRCAETVLAAWAVGVPRRLATFQLVTPLPSFRGLAAAVRTVNRSMQFRSLHAGLAVSHGNARLLVEQYGFPAARLHIVPNGVDLHFFADANGAPAFRARLNVPPGAVLIGVVGRLSRQKGQAVLLAALPAIWARFPHVHVALIGAGEQEQELRALAAQIDDAGRIHVVGALPRSAVPAALAALDLFVLPSLYEGLPFAVVEAMAAGLPIVATAVDGTAEAIRNGVTGLLVPPGDAVALASAITLLLDDAQLRAALAAACADAVRRFDQQAMLQATFARYEAVV